MNKFMSALFLAVISAFFYQSVLGAEKTNNTATITVFKEEKTIEKVVGALPEIYIDGPLDNITLANLEHAISSYQIDGAFVYLNSPGGNLMSGIDIGRLIRKHGWSTYVGARGDGYGKAKPGGCYSACVFAYIGGYYRYKNNGSELGVHRFSKAAYAKNDLDTAQVISALITNYIKDMGVDNGLFEQMVQAGSDEIIILSDEDARKLGVINDGVLPAQWAYENLNQYIYLKGEQQTWRGIGKFLLVCNNSSIMVIALYEVGGNAKLIAESTTHYSLRIDDDFIPVKIDHQPEILNNNLISTSFMPSQDQLKRISTAHKLGLAFQPGNPEIFFGFIINADSGHDRIISMIKNCTMQSSNTNAQE